MRWVILLVVVTACVGAPSSDAQGVHDPDGGGWAGVECHADSDCVAAASTCCECPSFALPASSGWQSSCDQVMCNPAPSCDEVHAACRLGNCTLACAPIGCEMSCADGFAEDAVGCQICACAAAPGLAECAIDDDCARVPADCCGCAKGGADTAVPAADVAEHAKTLDCPSDPACPGVDVCTSGATARCATGRCVLSDVAIANPRLPPDACGRSDLPPCAAGLRCVLNASPEAAAAGVGVCAP